MTVKFDVLLFVTLTAAMFCYVTPCSLVYISTSQRNLLHQSSGFVFYLENGGSRFFSKRRYVCKHTGGLYILEDSIIDFWETFS